MANVYVPTPNQEIRHPVLREPDALVENIYPAIGTEAIPDLRSQDVAGTFLIDRFLPPEEPKTRVVLVPTGYTLPNATREPYGPPTEVTRLRMSDEWIVSPKMAAGIMLGSLALFNVVGNHETISQGAKWGVHSINRVINPVEDTVRTETRTTHTPGVVTTIGLNTDTSDRVGSSAVDPTIIRTFLDKVEKTRVHDGGKLTAINVKGNASDEWSNNESIGVPNIENAQLGQERAQAVLSELAEQGLTLDNVEVTVGENEHILTPQQKDNLEETAQANGYSNTKSAIEAIDNGQPVSPTLGQKIKRLFTGKQNRGVSLTATIERPGKDIVTTRPIKVTVPGVDHKPEVPAPKFRWFIPMLPIPKLERYKKLKQRHSWQIEPTTEVLRPKIIREEQDQAWVRVRPEAVNQDGTLTESSWAYARKYEHLLRDRRVTDVLRADYKNPKGEDKSLRVMFVDESPAQETIDAFEVLLKKFPAMDNGKLGDRVNAIFVYPSENAGTEHRDPKRIAMGLDKQSHESILGTYTYVLDLVELHMPSTWDPEELEAMFEHMNGPTWVMAHEVAGHGTDETDEPLRLRRVRARGIPNAHIVEGEPRAHKMSRLSSLLQRLPRQQSDKIDPIEFDISYPVVDNAGQIVTVQAHVDEHDPRLSHASQSNIVGHEPTTYSGESDSEHYAETAASVTTGIAVPYVEALVETDQLRTDDGQNADFATGYRPDERGQALFTQSVGGELGSFPVTFAEAPEVRIRHIHPANDPLIRRELARTSNLRSLRPEEMTAILARIVRTELKPTAESA